MKMNIQKFAGKTNVFPVLDNKFKLGAAKNRYNSCRSGNIFSFIFKWCRDLDSNGH